MTDALVVGPESLKAFFRKLCIVSRRKFAQDNSRARLKARIALVRDALPKKQKQLASLLEQELAQGIIQSEDISDIVSLPKNDYDALTTILKHLTKRIDQLEHDQEGGSLIGRLAELGAPTREDRMEHIKERLAFLEDVLAYKKNQKRNKSSVIKLQSEVASLKESFKELQ